MSTLELEDLPNNNAHLPTDISSDRIESLLRREGFEIRSNGTSHMVYRHTIFPQLHGNILAGVIASKKFLQEVRDNCWAARRLMEEKSMENLNDRLPEWLFKLELPGFLASYEEDRRYMDITSCSDRDPQSYMRRQPDENDPQRSYHILYRGNQLLVSSLDAREHAMSFTCSQNRDASKGFMHKFSQFDENVRTHLIQRI